MKIILFGATGMVGQGVLRECLLAPDVERVLAVGRRATGLHHEKLYELIHVDFSDFSPVAGDLAGYDACFFCLGVSSAGMTEESYTRVTFDFTLAAAYVLAKMNPAMTLVYLSGKGSDSSGRGRTMWARVKGRTENELARMQFKATFMFRPGFIRPMHGIVSRTTLYRILYTLIGPLHPVLNRLFPDVATTTEKVGQAMLRVAREGAPRSLLETRDINALAR